MGEIKKQKNADAKLINSVGLILILIVVLRFGRYIILDAGLIKPNRTHAQYLQKVDQMSQNVFEGDTMLLQYDYKIRPAGPYSKYSFSSDKELCVEYSDRIELFLYLNDEFDDMLSGDQYKYIMSKEEEYSRRLAEIHSAYPYRELLGGTYIQTHYKYKPNTCWETSVKMTVSTDHYFYHTTSDNKTERLFRG